MRRLLLAIGIVVGGGLSACAPQLTEADYQRIKTFGPNNDAEYFAYNEHSGYAAWKREDTRMHDECETMNDIDAHHACLKQWFAHAASKPKMPGPNGNVLVSPEAMTDAVDAGRARDILRDASNRS